MPARRLHIGFVAASLLFSLLVAASPARAQRPFVQDLLKTFIESQISQQEQKAQQRLRDRQREQERQREKQRQRDAQRQNQPQRQPTRQPEQQRLRPSAGGIPSSSPGIGSAAAAMYVPTAQELRQAGVLLAKASDEMARLEAALRRDVYREPAVRSILGFAMTVKARAEALAQQLPNTRNFEYLRGPLRQLDEDWHVLEHRLSNTANLSANTRASIRRINEMESELAKLFHVPVQVNLSEVAREASALNNALRTLLEDIRYEIQDSNQANRLLHQGRGSYEQSVRMIEVARGAPTLESLTAELNRLDQQWTAYTRQLRTVNNRFVQRQVQLVNNSLRKLHDHLYVDPLQTNLDDVLHTAQTLQSDIERLLKRVTLKMMTDLPAARETAVAAATDLESSCNDMVELLEAREDIDVVRDVYLYVNDEWERLKSALHGITARPAREAIRDANRSMRELQGQLGVQFEFDRNQAHTLVQRINDAAKHLLSDIQDVFGQPNNYPRTFQSTCLRDAQDFQTAVERLSRSINRGDRQRDLKALASSVAQQWQAIDRHLGDFRARERSHLLQIQRELIPLLVQLQTGLAN